MRTGILLAPVVASVLGSLVHGSSFASKKESLSRRAVVQNTTKETAKFFPDQKSERIKVRYGPFTVGPMTVNNGMEDFSSYAQPPCNDCLITWAQAGLEYEDGTVANADTNLWLHHVVFTNLLRTSAVCPNENYGDEFFASGNERTPIDICVNGTDQAGYYVSPTDSFGFLLELMNMEMTNQTAVLTMTWEYIPNGVPKGFDKVTALWLDIGGCFGNSDQPAKSTSFQYTSPAWKSDLNGRVTFVAGHLHDGATHLTVKRNSTVECDCEATYGGNSAYLNPSGSTTMDMSMSSTMSMSMSMSMSGMTMTKRAPASTSMSMSMPTSSSMSMSTNDTVHISSISTCANFADMAVDEEWTITAYYDPQKHALMTDTDGSLAPIMGIAILYVAPKNLTVVAGASSGTGTSSGSAAGASATGAAVAGKAAVGLGMVGLGLGALAFVV